MSINNAGKLPEAETSDKKGNVILMIALVIAGVVLLFSLIVGPRAVSVLYALAAPPDAPVPDGLSRVSQTSETHGVDTSVYSSSEVNACAVVRFYQDAGGNCVIEPGWCGANDPNTTELYTQPVASCTGVSEFSIFHMRWQAEIIAGYRSRPYTQVEVARSIFWTGAPEAENP